MFVPRQEGIMKVLAVHTSNNSTLCQIDMYQIVSLVAKIAL